jgi:hypothetical protein
MQSVSSKKRCNTVLFGWAGTGRFRFDLLPPWIPSRTDRSLGFPGQLKGTSQKEPIKAPSAGFFASNVIQGLAGR